MCKVSAFIQFPSLSYTNRYAGKVHMYITLYVLCTCVQIVYVRALKTIKYIVQYSGTGLLQTHS